MDAKLTSKFWTFLENLYLLFLCARWYRNRSQPGGPHNDATSAVKVSKENVWDSHMLLHHLQYVLTYPLRNSRTVCNITEMRDKLR